MDSGYNPYSPPEESGGGAQGGQRSLRQMLTVAPLPLGQAMGLALQLFVEQLGTILWLVPLIYLPLNLVGSLEDAGVLRLVEGTQMSPLTRITEFIFGPLATLVVVLETGHSVEGEGEKLGIWAALRQAGSRWFSAVGANFVSGLFIVLGLIALIVPGLMAAVAFAFVTQAVALRGQNASDSLRYSHTVVKGNGWTVFAAMGLVVLLMLSLAFSLGMAVGLLQDALGGYHLLLMALLTTVVDLVWAYAVVLLTLLFIGYDYQRERRRGAWV